MLKQNDVVALRRDALEIRALTIEMIGRLGKGHIGGSMSIVDVLALLYRTHMKVDPRIPGGTTVIAWC